MRRPRGAHDQYRGRLALLAEDRLLVDAIATWPAMGRDDAGTSWRRVYGRFMPWASPYARLVFERDQPTQTFVTVEVFEEATSDAGPGLRSVPELGWIRCSSLADDHGLPTLQDALKVEGRASIVRYRPSRRCTFRVATDVDTRYGKVFPDDAGAALHHAGLALWEARQAGELGFAVAEPIGWDAERRVLWQRAVAGRPLLDRLSDQDGVALAERMGRAAGTLPASTLRPSGLFDGSVQRARSWSYARELGARVPALADDAEGLGEALDAIHRLRPGHARPIHGAPHVNQWLEHGPHLALVDFDRVSMGDPELDVATFLGELDFEEELSTPVELIAAAFIAGYESEAGRLDGGLLSAYRSHKRLAKALRSARALRPDGDARATRHLASAKAALATLGGRG